MALAASLAFGPALAADLTPLPLERLLEMRVIAASSYEQAAREAPSSVSVITAEDIRTHGFRTIGEALASLPGLYLTDDLSYGYLGSRGFNRIGDYNSRFQLSVNGLRTNDALFDMAYLGTEFPLDMALIERIEFAPGPGSSIYGSNAVMGVINIVTLTGADLDGARVAAAAGSHHERELAVSFGGTFDSGVELLASVSGLRSDGPDFYFPAFDAPETNDGIAMRQNGERYRRGYLRVAYKELDLEMFGGRRDKTSPSIYYDSDFLRNENRVIDRIGNAVLRYRHDLAPGTALEARASVGTYDYTGLYPAVGGLDSRDDASGRWRGAELRLVTSRWDSHKVVAGIELQDDDRLDQRTSDAETVYLDRSDTGRRVGAYIQDELRFADGWLLNAGLRYDHYRTFGASTNPRIALIGRIAPGTTLKLLHGSAFRAPNAYELYYENDAAAAEALRPERLRSSEVVLERELGERSRWRASLYHYRFSDFIEQIDLDDSYTFRNGGAATGRGIEVAATALLPGAVRLEASAAFSDVRQAGGERLTNSPRYTARLGLEVPLGASGVRAAFDLGVVGPRLDLARARVPANVVASLVLTTTRPWRGATFSLGLYNLSDRRNLQPVSEYFVQTQLEAPGRNLRASVEWRY